jgi:dienelactone hydrolase
MYRDRFFLFLCLVSMLLTLSLGAFARADRDEFRKGEIIDRVVCLSDPAQSYALYLPAGYTPERKWPIIYGFDPGARGRLPVERFKAAAEKYGFIVAGSNNSRNGPDVPVLDIVKSFIEDAGSRLSIDEKRIYLTGFSGGARVACAVGFKYKGLIAGVIACGGGFPRQITPSAATPFALFAVAGTEDFNLPEVKRLGRALAGAGVPNRTEVFEGGHTWPPESVCAEAVEWMELRAMISGRREKSPSLIDELFKKQLSKAESVEPYLAYEGNRRLAEDFKGLKDVSEFERKAAGLKDSKEVRQYLKQEREQEEKQDRRSRDLFALKAAMRDPESEHAASDLKRAIADLRSKSQVKESSPDRSLARRLLDLLFISSYEESRAHLHTKNYEQAASSLRVAAEIRPENWRVHYELACAYALGGAKKKAIDSLKKAVEKGLSDAAELDRNPQLDSIREEAEYRKLVEGLKKSGES